MKLMRKHPLLKVDLKKDLAKSPAKPFSTDEYGSKNELPNQIFRG